MKDIIKIKFKNYSGYKSAYLMFSDCYSLKNLDLSSFDTSKITNMYDILSFCYSLKNLKLSSINTNELKNMRGIFYK